MNRKVSAERPEFIGEIGADVLHLVIPVHAPGDEVVGREE